MAKHLRTGIAAGLLFASIAAAATLLLNPRFVDNLALGALVFIAFPIVGGGIFGIVCGRLLNRLAHFGSSEDPSRAYRLLWTSLAALTIFLGTLSLLPPFLGMYSDSEGIRYGGALFIAVVLGTLGGWTAYTIVNRSRAWIWPLLLALPTAAVLAGGTTWGRGMGPGSRVLVLGFPGLSWSVAEDLIEKGEMPNLSTLRRRGSWGEVQSVKPLLPPVVWTSIATGKGWEEHGVMSFNATASDVQVKRIWDIYADRGWKIGLLGWPVTWPPPESVNGFVVPSIIDMGTDAYPRELGFIRELAMNEKTKRPRTWGRYWRYAFLGIRYGAKLGTLIDAGETIVLEPWRGNSLEAAQLFAKRKLRARLSCDHFIDLRRKSSPDFAAFNTNIIHVAQAHFWKYYEPGSFQDISSKDVDRYGSSVQDAYRIVDGFIGDILADTNEDDIVVVVSDHGAEAITDAAAKTYTLRLEPLLAEMRLKNVVEATNLGARTYLRMKSGHEGDLKRIRRLFDTARLGEENARAFQTRVDEWDNLVITLERIVNERPNDTVLFQGGRCAVSEIVRAVENQESSQMREVGALVLAGKGILPGRRIEHATLLDLVPTLLVLTNLDLAADMPGNVIESALAVPLTERLPGFVTTYEPVAEFPQLPSGG
jgi:hypothetical protein